MNNKKRLILVLALATVLCYPVSSTLDSADKIDRANRISYSLTESGLEKAYVNVSNERVIVHYEQPPIKSDVDVFFAWIYIYSVCAINHPESDEIVIRQFYQGNHLASAVVSTDGVFLLMGDEINTTEFGARVTVEGPRGLNIAFNPCPDGVLMGSECVVEKENKLPEPIIPGINLSGSTLLFIALAFLVLAFVLFILGVVFIVFWWRGRS